jgi:hypothetical protein
MPIILKDILRVANMLNQHIDGHVPRQAKGALMFLVGSNLLWSFIQILSNLATKDEHKVWVGVVAALSLSLSLLLSLCSFSCIHDCVNLLVFLFRLGK